jgi:hypothetical protein
VPSPSEIRDQVASELGRRTRLSVPAFAGGMLHLLATIVIGAVLRNLPTVGVFQALQPILRGEPNPLQNPRGEEIKYLSHEAVGLLAGSLLGAVSIVALVLVLMLLLDAARFRGAKIWRASHRLVLWGGGAVAVLGLGREILSAILTHKFAVGHDLSAHAVDAVRNNPLKVGVEVLYQLTGLVFAAGMINTTLNAQRVGLVPRWMGFLGMFSGIVVSPIIAESSVLHLIPAFWLVMMGILYVGKWSKGDPPAWAAGEARPWPSAARQRAESRADGDPEPAAADVAPEPNRPPSARSANKRRRKRRARG